MKAFQVQNAVSLSLQHHFHTQSQLAASFVLYLGVSHMGVLGLLFDVACQLIILPYHHDLKQYSTFLETKKEAIMSNSVIIQKRNRHGQYRTNPETKNGTAYKQYNVNPETTKAASRE